MMKLMNSHIVSDPVADHVPVGHHGGNGAKHRGVAKGTGRQREVASSPTVRKVIDDGLILHAHEKV